MDERLITQALQEIARKEIPDDMNRLPEIQQQLGRFSRSAARSRTSWVVAAILTMLAMSIVAYAAARLLQNTPLDPGLQGASEADLITVLNLQQTIDDVTVTLDYAYADSNRISISVSSEGTTTNGVRYRFGELALTDDTGHTFQTMFGGGGGGGSGGGGGGNGTGGQSDIASYNLTELGSYDASVIAEAPDEIHLRLETTIEQVQSVPASEATPDIRAGMVPGGGGGSGSGGGSEGSATEMASPPVPMTDQVEKVIGPFVYEFTIPFIAEQPVEPEQSATANDITMRLDRLVIAPSMTRGVVCLDPAAEPGYVLVMSLTVGGEAVDLGDISPSLTSLPQGSPVGCYDLQINQSLYNLSGEWTLSVDSLVQYLPVGMAVGSNGETSDFSIDGTPDMLAQVREKLEPALEPYGITLTEADNSLKFSLDLNAGIDENVIRGLVDSALREEMPGPWVFTFDVPPAS